MPLLIRCTTHSHKKKTSLAKENPRKQENPKKKTHKCDTVHIQRKTDIGVTRARNETMLIGCKGRKNTQAARDWDTSLDNRSILQFSSTTFNANFKRNKKCTVIINDTSLSIITDGGCDDCSLATLKTSGVLPRGTKQQHVIILQPFTDKRPRC